MKKGEFLDISNQKFGNLTAIKKVKNRDNEKNGLIGCVNVTVEMTL